MIGFFGVGQFNFKHHLFLLLGQEVEKYGFAEPLTVYAGENGKLYAFKGYNDEVRVYATLPDLLEAALQGHLPIGLDD